MFGFVKQIFVLAMFFGSNLFIVLFSIIFTINTGISTYFVYYKYINLSKKQLLKKVLSFKQ